MAFKEKRSQFVVEEAKFSTQRKISFYIIFLVTAVIAVICFRGTVEDVKNIYNQLVPFLGVAIGFWLYSSKGSADKQEELAKIRTAETPQASDTPTVGAAKETVVAAKATVAVAEDAQK